MRGCKSSHGHGSGSADDERPVNWPRTRWTLRTVDRHLADLGLAQRPDKTFVGRVGKGFDFLGYHFDPSGLNFAGQTLALFIERLPRLCEHEREQPKGPSALGSFVRCWLGRALGGLGTGGFPISCVVSFASALPIPTPDPLCRKSLR